MTIEATKAQLISELASSRSEIIQAIMEVPPERVDEIYLGSWSLKDMLAHLVGWDHTNQQAIQEILNDQPPTFFQYSDKDWHSYNQQLIQQYRRESFEQLLADLKTSHHNLLSLLESLPARDLALGKVKRETGRSVTIRNLLRAEARDEAVHARQVRAYFHGSRND